jgi:hypothetical protein
MAAAPAVFQKPWHTFIHQIGGHIFELLPLLRLVCVHHYKPTLTLPVKQVRAQSDLT